MPPAGPAKLTPQATCSSFSPIDQVISECFGKSTSRQANHLRAKLPIIWYTVRLS